MENTITNRITWQKYDKSFEFLEEDYPLVAQLLTDTDNPLGAEIRRLISALGSKLLAPNHD